MRRYGAHIDIGQIFSAAAVGTVPDIKLILFPFQFDIEIITAAHVGHIVIADTAETGLGIFVQINGPSGWIPISFMSGTNDFCVPVSVEVKDGLPRIVKAGQVWDVVTIIIMVLVDPMGLNCFVG